MLHIKVTLGRYNSSNETVDYIQWKNKQLLSTNLKYKRLKIMGGGWGLSPVGLTEPASEAQGSNPEHSNYAFPFRVNV